LRVEKSGQPISRLRRYCVWPVLIIDTTSESEHQLSPHRSLQSWWLAELTLGTHSWLFLIRARITRLGRKAVGWSRRAPAYRHTGAALPLNSYTPARLRLRLPLLPHDVLEAHHGFMSETRRLPPNVFVRQTRSAATIRCARVVSHEG